MSDATYMRRALELAGSAEGCVSPRPPVGAVVVDRQGTVVGEGSTQPDPGPHAEVVALRQAGPRARGATLYVTLEPCCHTGATPPCADAVIEAGITRVAAGATDPNPLVSGGGIRRLLEAGIDASAGLLGDECSEQIAGFALWVRAGRPRVTLKMAASLDGKVAAADGTSKWITGTEARAQVHDMRSRADAVLVGAGTVRTDDPQLTARGVSAHRPQPARVFVDASGRTPVSAVVFDDQAPTVVITTPGGDEAAGVGWRAAGAEVLVVRAAERGVDLHEAMRALGERGMCSVLCEGGPRLAGSLVAAGLADRFVLYVAPTLIGGDAPGMLAEGVKTISEVWRLRIRSTSPVGRDIRIDAVPVRGGSV